jgi:hypothetical protein
MTATAWRSSHSRMPTMKRMVLLLR